MAAKGMDISGLENIEVEEKRRIKYIIIWADL
ncbi:hypothetical protein [Acidiplasma cupricumulans]|nr:hypothetical protein [Acidiplasma cupricumulans]